MTTKNELIAKIKSLDKERKHKYLYKKNKKDLNCIVCSYKQKSFTFEDLPDDILCIIENFIIEDEKQLYVHYKTVDLCNSIVKYLQDCNIKIPKICKYKKNDLIDLIIKYQIPNEKILQNQINIISKEKNLYQIEINKFNIYSKNQSNINIKCDNGKEWTLYENERIIKYGVDKMLMITIDKIHKRNVSVCGAIYHKVINSYSIRQVIYLHKVINTYALLNLWLIV